MELMFVPSCSRARLHLLLFSRFLQDVATTLGITVAVLFLKETLLGSEIRRK